MPEAPAKTIEESIDETTWTPLAMHAKRGALFLVDASLELAVVGNAVAKDRQAVVAHWVASSLMRRPTEEERSTWSEDGEAHAFRFVIVQPYVLAQRIASVETNASASGRPLPL